jgi:hypothetical protein
MHATAHDVSNEPVWAVAGESITHDAKHSEIP